MAVDLARAPKQKPPAGERCCEPERRGLWAYYYVNPDALEELSRWLSG